MWKPGTQESCQIFVDKLSPIRHLLPLNRTRLCFPYSALHTVDLCLTLHQKAVREESNVPYILGAASFYHFGVSSILCFASRAVLKFLWDLKPKPPWNFGSQSFFQLSQYILFSCSFCPHQNIDIRRPSISAQKLLESFKTAHGIVGIDQATP